MLDAASGSTAHGSFRRMELLSLCMQLADFLTARVERAGGMMALPDVYCLFNRARGTELISPDDLLQVTRRSRAPSLSRVFRRQFGPRRPDSDGRLA